MAHRLEDEAGVTRALAIGIRMTPAEITKGRYMRAPDGHDAPISRGDALASVQDFIADEFLGGADEPEEEENSEAAQADDDEEGDPVDPDADPNDPEDPDAEAPEPIAAPISWDKDAKELFAQLPPELQSKVVEREAQRDKALQSATTEAANARRNADVEANAKFADTQRQYASHLEQLAGRFAPQRPDPAILAQDPQMFYQLQAFYEQEVAQQQELQQRASQTNAEAERREAFNRQHELQQDQVLLSEKLGDGWTDTGKRKALLTSLEEVGALLGYAPEIQGQANATDILALKAASEWKAKADKYDKLQSTKMTAVRAAKDAPRVAKPGTSQTGAEKSARGRESAWAGVKSSRGRDGDASAAFLESIGVKL